jgi:PAS domain S-box-containing protein
MRNSPSFTDAGPALNSGKEPFPFESSAFTGPETCAYLLAAIVNSSLDAIISTTLDGAVTSWNPAASALFGYAAEEMIGECFRRLLPRDRQDEEERILGKIRRGEWIDSYVTVRMDKSGRLIDVFLTASPIRDKNQKIIGVSKIIRNIEAQKRASDSIRESEENLRRFVDQAPVAIMMLDRDLRQLACSRRWIENYGFEGAFVAGRHHYDVLPATPERWREAHRRGLAGEVVRADEDLVVRPDGSELWVSWEVRPWLMSDQTVGGITIMAEDVTERVAAVRALRESELRMRLAQEAAKSGAWEWSLADNRIEWPEAMWSLYSLQKPENWEPTFKSWASLIHPADRERVSAAAIECAAKGLEIEVQWRVDAPEGEPERWLLARGKPIAGANGAHDRYFGVVIDITEQKLLEEALRESQERQSFLLALNDALRTIGDPVEAIATASEMLGKILGANQVIYAEIDEAGNQANISRDWSDGTVPYALPLYSLDGFNAAVLADLRSGRPLAIADVHAEDRTWSPAGLAFMKRGSVAAFITVPLVKDGRLVALLGVKSRKPHDWTKSEIALAQEVAERTWEAAERARVSQALRDSEGRLNFALTSGEVGTWEMSFDTGEIVASDQALTLLSCPPGTRLTLENFLPLIYPEDLPAFQASLQRTLSGGTGCEEAWRTQLADGSIRWLETRGETRNVLGKQVVSGLIQDITKKVEQKEAVEKAAKAKSEFLANMSHELRTPMHAILSFAKFGIKKGATADAATIEDYFKTIHDSGTRLLGLLNDLLDLAKFESGRMVIKKSSGDFLGVIDHTKGELGPLLDEKGITLKTEVLTEDTKATFDKQRMIQVLINLISNSIKFSSRGGEVCVTLSDDRSTAGSEVLRCSVGDEGPGIPETELEAVFDKFIQSSKTKSGAGGTGLGLSICREIVKAHDGRIWAENRKPKGAVFNFVIPRGVGVQADVK